MSNVNNILNNYDLDKDKNLDKLEKRINNLWEQLVSRQTGVQLSRILEN